MRDRHGRDRVRSDRQELALAVHARLFEQRPAPADARDLIAAHVGDVGGERLVQAGGHVGHHLVAAIRAGGEDMSRRQLMYQLYDRGRPRAGRIRTLDLCDVQCVDRHLGRPDRDGVYRPVEPAGQGEGLQRELVVRLDEDEHAHASSERLMRRRSSA